VTSDAIALQFRRLERGELELIWTIDRREFIANIYRIVDGELRLEAHHFDVQGWHPDNVRENTPLLYEMFDRGAIFEGAFDGDALVGNGVLDTIWRGPRGDLLQLARLHVSRDYRGKGVGMALFEHARAAARERGARGLYISSAESENTVRFYQGRGAVLIDTPDAELFAKEPKDIHFVCPV
jgi:GNAT superfamily N-acetyltransferase